MRIKFSILFLAILLSAASARADAVIGQPAPALTAKTLDGKDFDLQAMKSRVVVVTFWASWCTRCGMEMPALEAVYRAYHGKGLDVLAISADRPQARDAVDQVMHYFTFPAAMLDAVTKNELGTIASVPVTYVFGKDGKVENILTPESAPLTQAGLGDEVKALLDAKEETKPDAKTDDKPDAKP
ncbi:MAG: TlpA disulfide reductase family protein [Alphaproteobacteria bacterium]|nr:TlpA disulfide reductase family protein [Alphaproteobacteria bacterium]